MTADYILAVRIGPWTVLFIGGWSTIAYIVRERRSKQAEMEHRAAMEDYNRRSLAEWKAARLEWEDDDA